MRPTRSGPPAGGAQRQFILDLACVFMDCFGKAPSAARTGQFMETLNTIIRICDLGDEVGETRAKSVLKDVPNLGR